MKSAVLLAFTLLLVLVLFGVLSFIRVPAYEKGAWLVFGAIVAAFSGVLGFIFGIHFPKPADPELPPQ